MVEVTQEDRDAYLAMNMLPEFDAADVRAGLWDKVTGLQAFAAHREQAERETVEKIVAWLRESAAWHEKHDDGLSGFDGIRQGQSEAADAIEQGDWRND